MARLKVKPRKDRPCPSCDGQMARQRQRKIHYFNHQFYLVENVPSDFCPGCGEILYDIRVLKAIDRMLSAEHPVKEVRTLEVVEMPDSIEIDDRLAISMVEHAKTKSSGTDASLP